MTDRKKLSDEDLDTILAIARNEQSGRITPCEVEALVAAYRDLDRPVGEVAVKPLEWVETTTDRGDGERDVDGWEALSVVGEYVIQDAGGEWFLNFSNLMLYDVENIGRSDDPDHLREIAQADYESRIRSALAPSPAIGRETVDGIHTAEEITIRELVALLFRLLRRHVPREHADQTEVRGYIKRKKLTSPFRATLRSQP